MNVLVFDARSSVAHFVKSVLLAMRHRVAVSTDAEDAIRKLRTSLIDALVIGPEGAPRELADFVEGEVPRMPIVLAGAAVEIAAGGPVAAVLAAPLSAARLAAAFRRLEFLRRKRISEIPVEIAADGVSIACRLADLTPETLVLAGESDEFHRWLDGAPQRVEARLSGAPLAGTVTPEETSPPYGRLKRVLVTLEGDAARETLAKLLK